MELINLPGILNNKKVTSVLSNIDFDFPVPTGVYDLTNPVRNKIFNFNNFLSDLNIDTVLSDISSLPCDCQGSQYIDKDHGHILTGDLRIIQNNKLRKILCKGPKYRENKHIDFQEANDSIINGINNCITSWCNKKGIPPEYFSEWKTKVVELLLDI